MWGLSVKSTTNYNRCTCIMAYLVFAVNCNAQTNLIEEKYRNILDCDTSPLVSEVGRMSPCDSCFTSTFNHSNVSFHVHYEPERRGTYEVRFPMYPDVEAYNVLAAKLCKQTNINPDYTLQFKVLNYRYRKRMLRRMMVAVALSDSLIRYDNYDDWNFIKLSKFKGANGSYVIPLEHKNSVNHMGLRFSQKWNYAYLDLILDSLYLGSDDNLGCNFGREKLPIECNGSACIVEHEILLDSNGLSVSAKGKLDTLLLQLNQKLYQEISINGIFVNDMLDTLNRGEKAAFQAMYYLRDTKSICVNKWQVKGTNNKTKQSVKAGLNEPRLMIKFTYKNK